MKTLSNLVYGDEVIYKDIFGKSKSLLFIRYQGMVPVAWGGPDSLQMEFLGERGSLVHMPLSSWEHFKISYTITPLRGNPSLDRFLEVGSV